MIDLCLYFSVFSFARIGCFILYVLLFKILVAIQIPNVSVNGLDGANHLRNPSLSRLLMPFCRQTPFPFHSKELQSPFDYIILKGASSISC